MHAAVERALEVSSFWDAELRSELPSGAEIFDAHTHLGDDIDGMKGRFDELLGIMDAYGVVPGVHVLHGRARPASRVPGAERPHARRGRASRTAG